MPPMPPPGSFGNDDAASGFEAHPNIDHRWSGSDQGAICARKADLGISVPP